MRSRIIALLLAALMLLSLCACGAKDAPAQEPAEWSREGFFEDNGGNMLSVTWMDGWYVAFMNGEDFIEDSYGGFLEQDGAGLKGTLSSGGSKGEISVTVTEADGDGVMVLVDGSGDVYILKPMDLTPAPIGVSINTEGYGFINALTDGDTYQTADDFLTTSVILSLYEPAVYTLSARGEDGWEFVKWMKDGEDFSEEPVITVEFTESADFVAVFEFPTEIYVDPGVVTEWAESRGAKEFKDEAAFAELYLNASSDDAPAEGGIIVLWDEDLKSFMDGSATSKAFNLNLGYDDSMECAAVYGNFVNSDSVWTLLFCSVNFTGEEAAAAFYDGLQSNLKTEFRSFIPEAERGVKQGEESGVTYTLGKVNYDPNSLFIYEALYLNETSVLLIADLDRNTAGGAEEVGAFCGYTGLPDPSAMQAGIDYPGPEVEIDLGGSKIFSEEDIYDGVLAVWSKFADFEGCQMHSIRYAGDEASTEDNLRWMNELDPEGNYTQVAEFLSDFHSPVEDGPYAWEPNTEYLGWNWWLARTDGGDWQILTWGY